MRAFKSFCSMVAISLAAVAISSPSLASDRLKDAARSMYEGITSGAPLVAERSYSGKSERVRDSSSAAARLNSRLAQAPALDVIEDIYITCIVRHALLYGMATKESSTAVADASVVMCGRERANLVKGYRLALWSVMHVSVGQVDNPAFGKAAKARVDLIDRAIARIVSARIVHMRAMETLSPSGRELLPAARSEPTLATSDRGETHLEGRIRSIVEQL